MTSATIEDHRPAGNYRLFTHLPEGVSHAFYSAFLGRAHCVGPDFVRDRVPAAPAVAQTMDHGEMATGSPATPSVGQALFDKLRGLVGTWDAKLGNGVMTDTFKPFAFDTAVLGEEWLNGKQITSTCSMW